MSAARFDWRNPASDGEKLKLIVAKCDKGWGDELDTYLWYEVGDVDGLTQGETEDIVRQFFASNQAGFGEVEFHRSSEIPGNPMLLRLRGILTIHPSLWLRDRSCPLYQVGHGGMPGIKPDEHCINFRDEWKNRM